MSNVARFTHELSELDTVHIWDDFFWYVTAHQWTSLAADTTPTLTVGDAVNGVLALFTDTTDNNEVAVRSTAELFKVGTVAGGTEYLKDANGTVIRHTVAIASATEMNVGVYVKTGGGSGGETVNVDYVYANQNRI